MAFLFGIDVQLDFSSAYGSQSPQSGQWHSYVGAQFLLKTTKKSQSPQSGQWHSYSLGGSKLMNP